MPPTEWLTQRNLVFQHLRARSPGLGRFGFFSHLSLWLADGCLHMAVCAACHGCLCVLICSYRTPVLRDYGSLTTFLKALSPNTVTFLRSLALRIQHINWGGRGWGLGHNSAHSSEEGEGMMFEHRDASCSSLSVTGPLLRWSWVHPSRKEPL